MKVKIVCAFLMLSIAFCHFVYGQNDNGRLKVVVSPYTVRIYNITIGGGQGPEVTSNSAITPNTVYYVTVSTSTLGIASLLARSADANSEGKVITDLADLMPNTEYKITLNSKEAEFIRIKKGDGYQLLKAPSLDTHYYGKSEYSLVTTSDFTDQIYINVVALHRKSSEYVRERSQIFLLPQ